MKFALAALALTVFVSPLAMADQHSRVNCILTADDDNTYAEFSLSSEMEDGVSLVGTTVSIDLPTGSGSEQRWAVLGATYKRSTSSGPVEKFMMHLVDYAESEAVLLGEYEFAFVPGENNSFQTTLAATSKEGYALTGTCNSN